MEFASINTPAAAFVAGLTTSLHCVVMCGPLACTLTARPGERSDPQVIATIYQVSRILGYTLLGALAGGVGQAPLASLDAPVTRIVPIILALFFIFIALRLEKHLPRWSWLQIGQWRLQQKLRALRPSTAAAGLGLFTPVLPCGPLYFLLGISVFSGSALRGSELMLAFALGTLPLLWLAQSNFGWLRSKISPRVLGQTQTTLALTAGLVVLWRLSNGFGFRGGELATFLCWNSP